MQVTINGDVVDVAEGGTVDSLVRSRVGTARHVAVAVNGVLVPRRAWEETPLHNGDAVEVLTPTAGG